MVEELSPKTLFPFAPPGQRELFLHRLSSWIRCDREQQYEFLWRGELAFLTGGTDSRGWDRWLSYPRSKYEDECWSNWSRLALDVHDVWGHWRGSALPIGGFSLRLCVVCCSRSFLPACFVSPPGLQVLIFSQKGDPANAELWSVSSLIELFYGITSAATGFIFTFSCPLSALTFKHL